MKTIKTLGLLLLIAASVIAQPTQNDLVVSGFVTDQSGNAQVNHEVCVGFVSNNPSLPSDTICANTDVNGFYSIIVVNGSLTGPNVSFDVTTDDPCSFPPPVQTVDNQQGTIDSADVDFMICANGGNCEAFILASTDSFGITTFEASSNGTAPFTYNWSNGQTTQSIMAELPGVYCVEVTDSNGCSSTICDTIDCNGVNPSLQLTTTMDSINGSFVYTISANSGFSDYEWSTGSSTVSTTVQNPSPNGEVICVTVADASGCTATACDTLYPINGGCSVNLGFVADTVGGNLVYIADAGAGWDSYTWSNGDSTQQIEIQNPSPNGEVVCVTVVDANGCMATTCDTLFPNIVCNGVSPELVLYSNWSTTGGVLNLYVETTIETYAEYSWSDGTTDPQVDLQNPNPEEEIICVTVTDFNGCTESICDTFVAPTSNFGCAPISITTTVDTTGGGLVYTLAASGGYNNYQWWPNGETSQSIVLQSINPNGEQYCVSGIGGGLDCLSHSCEILFPFSNGSCAADIWYQPDVNGNIVVVDTLELLYAGTQSSGNSYSWTMTAGGQVWTASTQNFLFPLPPNLVPTQGVDVEVCVTVTDSLTNCVGSYCEIITLVPDSNIICDGMVTTTQDSLGLFYTLSATGFGVGPFSFDWSNGDTSQEITVGQSGVYCVDITNASGCVYTVCDTIGGSTGCDAAFVSSGPTQNGYTFTADVQDSTLSYQWLVDGTVFGGGYEATLQNLANGVYAVCLTVNDSVNNCFDTQCLTFATGCNAEFTTAGPTPTGTYTLTADNQIGDWNYSWTVNNQAVSSVSILQTSLPTGVNEVCLTVTDSLNNCTDTQCETIISDCDAAFTSLGPDSLGQYAFNADIQNLNWDYLWTNNGQPISSVSIMQTSLPNGVNEVCLTVVDSVSNCSDTQCQTITTGPCDASFTNFGLDSVSGEHTFSADIQSSDWNYLWTANNQVVSSVSIMEMALPVGVNEICLTVTDSINNCSETECQNITVNNNGCFGYIVGQAFAGSNNQPLNNGVVYLITHDTATNMLAAINSYTLGPDNDYQFGPLPCGDYMVKAAADASSPYYSNHIPTYYGNSPFWSFAQTVSLSQTTPQVTADVILITANNPGGPGFIGGDVTQGANKTDPGDPLSNMQVMLFDLNGNAITHTYTDGNGEFGFSNLAYGSYQVYVELLGVPTIPAYVTIGPDNPSEGDVHIYATYELVTTGIEEFDFDGAISEVYPNPVGNDAYINFNLETKAMVKISILDLTGRTISTASHSVSSGENQVRFDVDDLTDGYYLLNIQEEDGAFSVTRKFLRVD